MNDLTESVVNHVTGTEAGTEATEPVENNLESSVSQKSSMPKYIKSAFTKMFGGGKKSSRAHNQRELKSHPLMQQQLQQGQNVSQVNLSSPIKGNHQSTGNHAWVG